MNDQTIQTIINSIIPILVTIFFAWLGSRNEKAKRRELIDDSKQRIELINSYITTQELAIDDPAEIEQLKKNASAELYTVKASFDHKLQKFQKDSEKSEHYLQRFFLLYKMHTGRASFFRVVFFVTLIISLFWSLLASSVFIYSTSNTALDIASNIFVYILVSLPVVLFAFLFRWLALKFDKSAPQPGS